MSLRKKLGVIGSDVEIHIPASDPHSEVPKELDLVYSQYQALVDERNLHKQRSEYLVGQLQLANERLHRGVHEGNGWRRLALRMIRVAGVLGTKLKVIDSLFKDAANEVLEVEHYASQLPQEQPAGNGGEAIDLDAPLHDQAPEPTLEEVQRLQATLAKLPQGR